MSQSEQVPQPNRESIDSVYDDALAGVDFSDLACQIKEIEAKADKETDTSLGDTEDEKSSAEALGVLAEYFDLTKPRESIFTGVAYKVKDNDDLDTDEPHLMMDAEVTFEDLDCTEIDDASRVVFYLKRALTHEKTQVKTSTRYAVFLESILRLEYIRESLLAMLARHADDAHILTASKDFLVAQYKTQVSALQSLAITFYNELLSRVDYDHVDITCESCIVRTDAMNGEGSKLSLHNQPNMVMRGSLSGCMYPDVLNRGERPFRTEDDFIYSSVPHIVMRDSEAGKTTYIAIDAITSIE
jgi:hypothetical protein